MGRRAPLKDWPRSSEIALWTPLPWASPARPRPHRARPISKHLRRTKLAAAFAITALVGIGSYAATYHALVIISVPSAAPGSVVLVPSGDAHSVTVPSTATPTSAAPLR